MSEPTFTELFRPVKIGGMILKNRIAMAPMGTSLWSDDGLVTERVKAYYEARARGGAGMVIIENSGVDYYRGMHRMNGPMIDSDLALPGLAELAKTVQQHRAKAVIQLNHSGRVAKGKLSGFQPVAPSPVLVSGRPSRGEELPHELDAGEINEIVDLFARGATRARKAGFDGIEVHAAHHYLIAQFLSPISNQRRDGYGGSLENRARFLLEVVAAVRRAVGPRYPFWCRINSQESGADGCFTLEEGQTVAIMLREFVDALSVSAYGYGAATLAQYPDTPGELVPLAAQIKKVTDVPVIAVGRLTPEVAEDAIRAGKADIAAFGRALLTDPELPNKAREGKRRDIRPCIACFHCIDSRATASVPLSCAVNGEVGRENEFRFKPAAHPRRVVIIGGGPAGMEAARVLALRGHQAILLEREDSLGGQLNLAMVPPHKKERLFPLLGWFLSQLKDLKVETRLSTEADTDLIKRLRPRMVILAAGALPIIPQLPGVEQRHVVTAMDVLAGRAVVGNEVVIIGGGSIGCETAEFLHEQNRRVTVVEMLPQLAGDMGAYDRFRLMNRIAAMPIKLLTGARCCAIAEGGVKAIIDDREQVLRADTVVLAVGNMPNNALFPELRAAGLDVRMAGDCWHVGKIARAVYDGLRLGSALP